MSTGSSPLADPVFKEEKSRKAQKKKEKKTDERFFMKLYPLKGIMGYSAPESMFLNWQVKLKKSTRIHQQIPRQRQLS
jgi:hypothetical protein